MIVDCMACLVALSKGLPKGGTHLDANGVTHATLRARYMAAITCTIRRDSRNREIWSALATWVPRQPSTA